jgi:hypothetical protein
MMLLMVSQQVPVHLMHQPGDIRDLRLLAVSRVVCVQIGVHVAGHEEWA